MQSITPNPSDNQKFSALRVEIMPEVKNTQEQSTHSRVLSNGTSNYSTKIQPSIRFWSLVKNSLIKLKQNWGGLILIELRKLIPIIILLVVFVLYGVTTFVKIESVFDAGANAQTVGSKIPENIDRGTQHADGSDEEANSPVDWGLGPQETLKLPAADNRVFFPQIIKIVLGIVGIVSLFFIIIYSIVVQGAKIYYLAAEEKGKIARKQAVKVGWKKFFGLLGVYLYYGLIVFCGTVLFIVPGIMWAIKYFFAPYIYITRGMEDGDVFKKSAEISKGYRWSILEKIVLSQYLLLSVFILALIVGAVFVLLGKISITLALMVGIILVIFYIIFTIAIQLYQFIYNFNIYKNIFNLKQQAQTEQKIIQDGLPIWRKILIVFLILLGVFANFAVEAFDKTGKLDGLRSKILPSLSGSLEEEAQQKSRDTQRLSNIKDIQAALELYHLDNYGYPRADQEIILGENGYTCLNKEGFQILANCPDSYYFYSGLLPANPEPGGKDYVYLAPSIDDYELFFSLEGPTGGFEAGEYVASSGGIDPVNFWQTQEVFEDLLLGESRQKSRDAKRISDIKQIKTALKLYYSDYSKYPVEPIEVVLGQNGYGCLDQAGFNPVNNCSNPYMGQIPTNPEPGGLDYDYQSEDGQTYRIKFSLEIGTDEFFSGDHFVTPAGIDLEDKIIELQEQNLDSSKENTIDNHPNPEQNLIDCLIEKKMISKPEDFNQLSEEDLDAVMEFCSTMDATEKMMEEWELDPDKDGLPNRAEETFGTDKNNPDTDGDGYLDGDEIKNGYNPLGEGKL